MISRWVALSKPLKDMYRINPSQTLNKSKLLREEIEASSYYTISTLKRTDFEPQGWSDAVKAAPPFSRSSLFIIGGALLISAFAALTSPSPMTVTRAARYHLRIAAVGLLFFAGEDYAASVIARAEPWGHRRIAATLATCAVTCQAALTSYILTKDAINNPTFSCNLQVWLMTLMHAGVTLATSPKWVVIPRFVFYGISATTLPAVAYRRDVMSARAEQLLLSDYRIPV